MARDILAVQGAGVGVERVFSIARSNFKFNRPYAPDTFRAILMTQQFMREQEQEAKRMLDELDDAELSAEEAEQECKERQDELEDIILLDHISDDDERSAEDYTASYRRLNRSRKQVEVQV